MNRAARAFGMAAGLAEKAWHRVVEETALKSRIGKVGRGVRLGRGTIIEGGRNLTIGDRTYIGPRACLYSLLAPLRIGADVMFGPNVTVITGDHRIDLVGRTMRSVGNDEKLPTNDAPVIIEDDVWVGANVVILKGCTIGTGSVIAAGAVVTSDVEPFSIYGGIPAKKLKERFTNEEKALHIRRLNLEA